MRFSAIKTHAFGQSRLQNVVTAVHAFVQQVHLLDVAALVAGVLLVDRIVRMTFAAATLTAPDYAQHAGWGVELVDGVRIVYPHFLYHVFVGVLYKLLYVQDGAQYGSIRAGYDVTRLLYALTLMVLYVGVRSVLPRRWSLLAVLVALILSLSLLFVGPINLLTIDERRIYLGYLVPHIYHNPTMVILKPLALVSFWLVWRGLSAPVGEESWSLALWSANVLVLTTLAKPNYTLCLLPAVGVYALWQMVMRREVNWRFVLVGVYYPALFILGVQYVFAYVSGNVEGGVEFAPFAYFRIYYVSGLMPKFFLSIAFPLMTSLLFWRSAVRSLPFNLAWLVFAAGTAQTYLLSEQGGRAGHGNFLWSGQIAVFILMVAAMLFLLDTLRKVPLSAFTMFRLSLCLLVFGSHLAGGLVWLYIHVMPDAYPMRWW